MVGNTVETVILQLINISNQHIVCLKLTNVTCQLYLNKPGEETQRGAGDMESGLTAAAAKSLQSCPSLCNPIDGSPTGSPVPGILQARTLEWVAISFSNAWKWKVKVKSLSCVWLLATPWTAAYQGPPSMGFSRQEYWNGVPLPSPQDLLRGDKKETILFPRLCKWKVGSWDDFEGIHACSQTVIQGRRLFLHLLLAQCAQLLQSCPTLCNPMDGSLSGSFVHGIFLARILEWIAISFSRGFS